MEKEEYILKPSLKLMTLSTIIIDIWNQPDILPLALVLTHNNFEEQRPKIEEKVRKKVSKLLLPETLKKQLIPFIPTVGREMLKWREFHKLISPNLYFDLSFLSQLRWTSVGRVDYRKTAEILIKEERIDVISSYKLACIYCLDDIIRIVWEKLDDDIKSKFSHEDYIYFNHNEPRMVIFWSCLMRGESIKPFCSTVDFADMNNMSVNQFVFIYSSQSGNIAATKYFFQKLTFEEREACLLKTVETIIDIHFPHIFHFTRYSFSKDRVCDVLCYLLSELSTELQIKVFKEQSIGTLCCLLRWPWIEVFKKVAELVWSILSYDDFHMLLEMLVQHEVSSGLISFKLFRDFFSSAPREYRNYIVDEIRENRIEFLNLLNADNTEFMESVVRNVHEKGRPASIIYQAELHICWELIDEGKWSLLELFVSSCRLSSEGKATMKKGFMNYIAHFYAEGEIKRKRRMWGKFFQLIDNANVNEDNKKIVEEMERPTRKLRREK